MCVCVPGHRPVWATHDHSLQGPVLRREWETNKASQITEPSTLVKQPFAFDTVLSIISYVMD